MDLDRFPGHVELEGARWKLKRERAQADEAETTSAASRKDASLIRMGGDDPISNSSPGKLSRAGVCLCTLDFACDKELYHSAEQRRIAGARRSRQCTEPEL
jgi:hypothetical protein